jgi:hypothetical protein
MAITEHASGSQTATITTEHALVSNSTDDGVYQVFVDCNAMVAGDITELTIKEKARSSDSQRVVFRATLAGAQAEPLWVSPSLILMHGWDVTLKQTAGTGRAYPWSVRKVA